MQRRELRVFAVAALLQLAAAFCGAAADAKASLPSNGGAAASGQQRSGAGADLRLRLLPAAHVLLLWAAGHTEVAGCAAFARHSQLLLIASWHAGVQPWHRRALTRSRCAISANGGAR